MISKFMIIISRWLHLLLCVCVCFKSEAKHNKLCLFVEVLIDCYWQLIDQLPAKYGLIATIHLVYLMVEPFDLLKRHVTIVYTRLLVILNFFVILSKESYSKLATTRTLHNEHYYCIARVSVALLMENNVMSVLVYQVATHRRWRFMWKHWNLWCFLHNRTCTAFRQPALNTEFIKYILLL